MSVLHPEIILMLDYINAGRQNHMIKKNVIDGYDEQKMRLNDGFHWKRWPALKQVWYI